MSRLPLRLRLTLAFTLVMAVVLAGFGALLHVRVGDSLLEHVDESLSTRADALAAAVQAGEVGRVLAGHEEEFAQLLGPAGDVVAATPGFGQPLVSQGLGAAGGSGRLLTEAQVVDAGDGEREPVRLLLVPLGSELLVVGASLEDRADALDQLSAQLAFGLPVALLLAAGAGYLLAGAALRPVEAMRRRAAGISAETLGERLPLPAARDEIHRLGVTLNAMLDRLDNGLRRERRFVADASHELRTPLALLRAELELALRRERTGDELEDAIRSASDEVDRLVRLAEGLLLLASSEEGGLPLHRSRFPARDLLDAVAARFAPPAAAAGRSLDVTAAPDEEVVVDRLRIEQALGNLVDNALRHGAGRVELEAAVAGTHLVLRVRDQGPGFPEDFLPHAFERLSRADEARTRGGAGLGLAIADAVVRAHGGEIEARNGAGGGAEVAISLPRAEDGRGWGGSPR